MSIFKSASIFSLCVIILFSCSNEDADVYYYNLFFDKAEKDDGVLIPDFDSSEYKYYFSETREGAEFRTRDVQLNDSISFSIPAKFRGEKNESGFYVSEFANEQIVVGMQTYFNVTSEVAMSGILEYASENNINLNFESAKYFDKGNTNFRIYELQIKSKDEINSSLGFLISIGGNSFLDFSYSTEKSISNFQRGFFIDMFMSSEINGRKILGTDFSIYKMKNLEVE